jgi:hypothetical protein
MWSGVHQLEADLAHLSTHGRQLVVENSGQMIQFEVPDEVESKKAF